MTKETNKFTEVPELSDEDWNEVYEAPMLDDHANLFKEAFDKNMAEIEDVIFAWMECNDISESELSDFEIFLQANNERIMVNPEYTFNHVIDIRLKDSWKVI